jgi:hypothetical protein
MALIFWLAVIGFVLGYLGCELLKAIVRGWGRGDRRRDPQPRTTQTSTVPCPYCRKASTLRIGPLPEIECSDCGIFSPEPKEHSEEVARFMDLKSIGGASSSMRLCPTLFSSRNEPHGYSRGKLA